ncbi:MAG: Gfo/Idh/MocA family oxidoreductase [Anaerolineae bacterium]
MPGALRVVLAGCGRISQTWLRTVETLPDLEIVGLLDVLEANAQHRAAQFGLSDVLVGTDLDAVLDATEPDILFNCTSPEAHVDVSLTALRHGCHILSEKPLAVSLEGARRLTDEAVHSGKILAVTQNRRYHPMVRRLRALLQSGVLGPLTTVESGHYMGNHFGGFRESMRHPLLLDMAIHTFDAARCITMAEPVSVYCREWNPRGSWYAHGASAVAIFEMSDGVVYTYRGSWCSEGMNTSPDSTWRLIGEEGSATWDSFDSVAAEKRIEVGGLERTGSLQSSVETVEVPPFRTEDKIEGHASLIREFVHCVQTGALPETVCTDNIKSLAMVLAAVESAETGRTVEVRW